MTSRSTGSSSSGSSSSGPRIRVFIATSLDGYIARANGDLDWLDAANKSVPEGEDCGYGAFMAAIDVLVMGRRSYEKVLSFGAWPYGDKQVIVLSRHPVEISASLSATVSHSDESPHALRYRLSKAGVQQIYIDGGVTIQGFLEAGLIDDMTITVIPVILGGGVPLFGGVDRDILLRRIATKSYEFGFVQLTYAVESSESAGGA